MDYPARSLFNGNISYMTTAIASPSGLEAGPVQIASAPMVRKFRYDKINRIAEQEVAFVGANKSWNNASTAYATNYSYDSNGNLLSLNRNQQSGVIMDSLQYTYYTSNDDYYSGQIINRLDSVVDLSVYNQYELDFKDTSHYTYDEIGNLITDSGEEIAEIVWNTYGKVSKVIREQGSLKADLEFWYDPMGNRLCKIVKPRDEYGSPTNQSQWIFTWYMRDAQGNVMAVYNETHATDTARLYVSEYSIYGSSRLGVHNLNELISEIEYDTWQFADGFFKSDWTEIAYTELNDTTYSVNLSDVQYELSNHLGNVLTTISAKPIFLYDQNDDFEYKSPEILTVSDYYPFGSEKPATSWVADSMGYRYGFNNMEKDDELKGSGNSYDFGARIYDPRVGRFLSIDPDAHNYPNMSSYCYAANSPVIFIDLDGAGPRINRKERSVSANIRIRYSGATEFSLGQMMAIAHNIQSSVSGGFVSAGITPNITVEWSTSKGGLFGTGLMAGWFSNNVYFDIDDEPERSSARKAGNKGRFQENDVLSVNIVPFHEFLHMCGLSDRYHYVSNYDRDDGILSEGTTIPMTNIQITNEPATYDPNNTMSNGTLILSDFQQNIIFRRGVRALRAERNYTQVYAFLNSNQNAISIDYVSKGNIVFGQDPRDNTPIAAKTTPMIFSGSVKDVNTEPKYVNTEGEGVWNGTEKNRTQRRQHIVKTVRNR